MIPEEAKAVAAVVVNADSGCPVCVGNLLDYLTEAFPDYDWGKLADEAQGYDEPVYANRRADSHG